MLIFKEGLESSPSFWMAAIQTKSKKLAEPTILREMTGRKIKEKKEERQELIALLAGNLGSNSK